MNHRQGAGTMISSSRMRASSFFYNMRRSIASSATTLEAAAPSPGKKGGKGKKDKDSDETSQGKQTKRTNVMD
jgi:hypothetical protein